jgi:hypothetical protein
MNRPLASICAVFRKDMRQLWPLVLLVVALLLARALISPLAKETSQFIGTLSTCVNVILIVAAIHIDAPANLRLDWLTRPIAPAALLAEKLLFLFVTVLAPSFASALVHWLQFGDATIWQAVQMTAADHFVMLAVALPLMAIAAMTTALIEAGIVGLLVAALAMVIPQLTLVLVGLSPESVNVQSNWTLVRALAFLAIVGSAVTLWLQYVRPRSHTARFAFAATVLLAMTVQLAFMLSLSPSH